MKIKCMKIITSPSNTLAPISSKKEFENDTNR